jgi:hypothetical protein
VDRAKTLARIEAKISGDNIERGHWLRTGLSARGRISPDHCHYGYNVYEICIRNNKGELVRTVRASSQRGLLVDHHNY